MSPRGCSAPPGWLARAAAGLRFRPEGAVSSHQRPSRRMGTAGSSCWSQGLGGGWRSTDWKGPHVFCSQRLESHLVTGTAFALLRRQRQLALPWQPGGIHFQLTPEFSITAERRKTCLKSESHEQKFTLGNCEGLKKGGWSCFLPVWLTENAAKRHGVNPNSGLRAKNVTKTHLG